MNHDLITATLFQIGDLAKDLHIEDDALEITLKFTHTHDRKNFQYKLAEAFKTWFSFRAPLKPQPTTINFTFAGVKYHID